MGYHPLLDECLKGAQRVIKAQGDIKFEGMLYRQHRLKVPESVVRGYEELLKYELLSLSITLDKWVEQGAPIEEKDNGNK